jgi:hypothetical protein
MSVIINVEDGYGNGFVEAYNSSTGFHTDYDGSLNTEEFDLYNLNTYSFKKKIGFLKGRVSLSLELTGGEEVISNYPSNESYNIKRDDVITIVLKEPVVVGLLIFGFGESPSEDI